MKVKKDIFSKLDQITPQDCILLSNTSTLDIDEMASAVKPSRRSLFAGWHFFSPAHIMKLVEIVRGKATSMDTVGILQSLTKRIGKTGVVVGNCDGFVGNRMLISYGAESTLLLEEGVATVASVDRALVRFGMPMGPLQMGDLAGLDIGYNIRKQRGWINEDGSRGVRRPKRYPEVADVIVSELKRLGQKTGKVRVARIYDHIDSIQLLFSRLILYRAGTTTTRVLDEGESLYRVRKWMTLLPVSRNPVRSNFRILRS